MFRPLSLAFFGATLLLAACQYKGSQASERRRQAEAQARSFLVEARAHLQQHDFARARQRIYAMRDSCRYALEAREEGIVLLDSVELLMAQHHLQGVDGRLLAAQERGAMAEAERLQRQFDEICRQVKFYQRKLQYDKQQRRSHP